MNAPTVCPSNRKRRGKRPRSIGLRILISLFELHKKTKIFKLFCMIAQGCSISTTRENIGVRVLYHVSR